MNIAHFSYEYPPSTTGGLGTYLEALVRSQRQAGHEVDVFFLGNDEPPLGTTALPFYQGGQLLRYSLANILRLSGRTGYDIAVCHDWCGVLVSEPLWRQAPLVMTCHLPLADDIGYYDDLPCQYANELEFSSVVQANLIIAVSEATKNLLTSIYPFISHKITVVHNGTDMQFFSPGYVKNGSLVTFVGRFVEQKGFDFLPEIFQAVKKLAPGARFRVAGIGPLEDEFAKKVARLGMSNEIKTLGFLSLEGVRDLYRETSVVLMPSMREPFGLVAIESMASGVPVVGSAVGGLKEIIEHEENGILVQPGEVDEYARAVASLLHDPQRRQNMGVEARRTVAERFDQRTCFQKTMETYAHVARTPEARGLG